MKFSGFIDNLIWSPYAKITKIVGLSFEGGVGKKFFDPQYLPNFGLRKVKFLGPLEC